MKTRCWEWPGKRSKDGYGVHSGGDTKRYVHRMMWEMARGPIPDGLCVLHKCDNPPCCRPSHLFLGTVADNNADMKLKGRAVCGHRASILNEDQVIAIMARMLTGRESRRTIAADIGMSDSCVRGIWEGKSWRHLFEFPPGVDIRSRRDL